MLRLWVVGWLLANAAYFAWTQGWLMALGWAPVQQAEPQRLTQQINPEAMRLLDNADPGAAAPAAAASAPELAASAAANLASAAVANTAPAGECLQAGLFSDVQANTLRTRLQSTLPEGSWAFSSVVEPGRWIIYMGPYPNEEAVAKKRNELRARGVKFESVQNPRLNLGLSLGNFASKQEADSELARDAERGVRTARVIQERAEVRGQRLTVPIADAALKAQLAILKPSLGGKALVRCG